MNTEKSSTESYLDGFMLIQDKVLQSAVRKGNLERVQLLVEHGADIDTFDDDGMSLSAIASQHGHAEIVDYLAGYSE